MLHFDKSNSPFSVEQTSGWSPSLTGDKPGNRALGRLGTRASAPARGWHDDVRVRGDLRPAGRSEPGRRTDRPVGSAKRGLVYQWVVFAVSELEVPLPRRVVVSRRDYTRPIGWVSPSLLLEPPVPRFIRRRRCLVFSRSSTPSRLNVLKSRSVWRGLISRSTSSKPTTAAPPPPHRLAPCAARLPGVRAIGVLLPAAIRVTSRRASSSSSPSTPRVPLVISPRP